MFEMWICKEEPTLRLVVAQGGNLPANLGQRDWTLAGPFTGSSAVTAGVAEHGYAFLHADEPVPDAGSLKNSGGSGG